MSSINLLIHFIIIFILGVFKTLLKGIYIERFIGYYKSFSAKLTIFCLSLVLNFIDRSSLNNNRYMVLQLLQTIWVRIFLSFLTALFLGLYNLSAVERINLDKKGEQYRALILGKIRNRPVQKAKSRSLGLSNLAKPLDTEPPKINIQLDESNQLKEIRTASTGPDSQSIRFRQYYKNIPIWGQQIRSTLRKGNLHRIKGELFMGIEVELEDVEPEVEGQDAISKAKDKFSDNHQSQQWQFQNETAELVIFLQHNRKPRLAYVVRFFAKLISESTVLSQPVMVIDAKSAEMIQSWDSLKNTSN